jgi:hypothetical protein
LILASIIMAISDNFSSLLKIGPLSSIFIPPQNRTCVRIYTTISLGNYQLLTFDLFQYTIFYHFSLHAKVLFTQDFSPICCWQNPDRISVRHMLTPSSDTAVSPTKKSLYLNQHGRREGGRVFRYTAVTYQALRRP